jgi:hypothetical protein
MERRNRSVEALNQLKFIDTLDEEDRMSGLQRWVQTYLSVEDKFEFDLEFKDLQVLLELYYKNINFMKEYNLNIQQQMAENKKLKAFVENAYQA